MAILTTPSAFRTIFDRLLLGLDLPTPTYGVFCNYLNCDYIINEFTAITQTAHQLAKSAVILHKITTTRSFTLSKYLNLAVLKAYYNFSFGTQNGQNGSSKVLIEQTRAITSLPYEQRACSKVFRQMLDSVPPHIRCFRTVTSYRLMFDKLYSIIQPTVKTNFISVLEKRQVLDAIFIMIENGISVARFSDPGDWRLSLEVKSGVKRGVVFEPFFEKYLVYRVSQFFEFFWGGLGPFCAAGCVFMGVLGRVVRP